MKNILEKLRQTAQRHLTRPRRIALDLALSLCFLLVVWWWYGCPLPTGEEGRFRQMERMNLLEPSRIVAVIPRTSGRHERLTRSVYVGLGEDWAAVGYIDLRGEYEYWEEVQPNVYYSTRTVPGQWLECYPLEPGVRLIPVTWPVAEPEDRDSFGWGLVAAELPQGAASGELTLDLPDGTRAVLTAEAAEENTLWFWVPDQGIRWHKDPELDIVHTVWARGLGEAWMEGQGYALRLFDQTGGLLLEQTGTVPEQI